LFNCSLSNFSDYSRFILFYYFPYFRLFSSVFFPANIFIKRKVLAQGFQDPPVSKQSMQGASKVQKSKNKAKS
jgi:hypothetical protein